MTSASLLGHDLVDVVVEQPLRRVAARRRVDKLVTLSPGEPPPRRALGLLQQPTRVTDRPVALDRMVDQIEQSGLGDRVHTSWDPATQPQRLLGLPPVCRTRAYAATGDGSRGV